MLRLFAGFLTGFCICTCYAQDQSIVITATRFPDAKRDLPVGVTVITADDIRQNQSQRQRRRNPTVRAGIPCWIPCSALWIADCRV